MVSTQQGRKLAGWAYLAPTNNLNISSDRPACKNIAKVNAKVTPDQLQRPVAVYTGNRFSPLYEVEDLN